MRLARYWIFIVKDAKNDQYSQKGLKIFEHRMGENFWGIKKETENGRKAANIEYLGEGDYVLFYLSGNEGHCFLGTRVLASGHKKLPEEGAKIITHEKFLDWNEGVDLKPDSVDTWTKPLPIERLRGKVDFVPVGENYGSYLQGSVKKIKQWEYDTIIREHQLMH
jgi:hypothetical protein